MATVISVPLAQQLQIPFIKMRDLWLVREKPSRMYSWTALISSQILAEIPWNVVGSTVFFVCWYWTVGFSSEASRAGYAYLMLGVIFPLYYTTIGHVSDFCSSHLCIVDISVFRPSPRCRPISRSHLCYLVFFSRLF